MPECSYSGWQLARCALGRREQCEVRAEHCKYDEQVILSATQTHCARFDRTSGRLAFYYWRGALVAPAPAHSWRPVNAPECAAKRSSYLLEPSGLARGTNWHTMCTTTHQVRREGDCTILTTTAIVISDSLCQMLRAKRHIPLQRAEPASQSRCPLHITRPAGFARLKIGSAPQFERRAPSCLAGAVRAGPN